MSITRQRKLVKPGASSPLAHAASRGGRHVPGVALGTPSHDSRLCLGRSGPTCPCPSESTCSCSGLRLRFGDTIEQRLPSGARASRGLGKPGLAAPAGNAPGHGGCPGGHLENLLQTVTVLSRPARLQLSARIRPIPVPLRVGQGPRGCEAACLSQSVLSSPSLL